MKNSTLFLIAAIAIFLIAVIAIKSKVISNKKFSAKAKRLLSKNEQPMYFRLLEAFPELVVLAQVSFSALMTGKTQSDRNKFNRKMADFVLCSKAFEVIAVIELDDSSHAGRRTQDADRDAMLVSVGYRVIRFKKTPNIDEVKTAVYPPPVEKTKK
jgi:anaerobic ribonucleoside-triphosphate reductase